MALDMRASCEKCQAPLTPESLAFICSYECTYCPVCTMASAQVCPTCGGELVRRPRRNS